MIYSTRQAQGITRFLSKRVRSAYKRIRSTAWMRSIVAWKGPLHETRSNEKRNGFEREAKHVRTGNQTRSNETPNETLSLSLKCAQARLQTLPCSIRNSFKVIHWQRWLTINSLFTYMNKFTYMNRELFRFTQGVQITEDVLYFD